MEGIVMIATSPGTPRTDSHDLNALQQDRQKVSLSRPWPRSLSMRLCSKGRHFLKAIWLPVFS